MKNLLKTSLLAAIVLAGVSTAKAQVSVGISIGVPPPVRVVAYVPDRPAPDFLWVEGYWYPVGHHYKWHDGYWTRPPYAGAYWVAPHHDGHQYFAGYWQGPKGRADHDHHWDRDHERDFHGKDHDNDHGHGHGDDHDNGHGHGHD